MTRPWRTVSRNGETCVGREVRGRESAGGRKAMSCVVPHLLHSAQSTRYCTAGLFIGSNCCPRRNLPTMLHAHLSRRHVEKKRKPTKFRPGSEIWYGPCVRNNALVGPEAQALAPWSLRALTLACDRSICSHNFVQMSIY